MLDQIRNFQADKNGLEDLIHLLSVATGLRQTYESVQVESPEWLDRNMKAIRRAIKDRTADDAARRLAKLKAQRTTLLTASERRAQIDEEIAKLEPVVAAD